MMVLTTALAWSQTQVDLKTQAKSVDFSAAQGTKPVQTGAVLPATCTVGQMFFSTSASGGSNLYGCIANNTWLAETGAAALTIQNQGTTVGARPILDFATGVGISQAISDTGTSMLVQNSLDTALALTRAGEQAGAGLLCASASGSSSAYTCSLSPALAIYTTGMTLRWRPDVNGAGGATTLNVDALGVVPVKLADGVTNPEVGDIVAGRAQQIWYDGANFRLMYTNAALGLLGEAQPACGAAVRGRTWFVAGATGVKDSYSVCAKDATNAYAWRTIY
jgi:hypothetical protein